MIKGGGVPHHSVMLSPLYVAPSKCLTTEAVELCIDLTVVEYGKSRMIHVISQVRKLMLKEIEFGTENNLFWKKTELDLTHRFQNTNEWFQEKRLWLPKYFK